ncbi:MAG: hypothetical protein H6624_05785 [Bdellovibrionaceae bacterium]|nr:hypothetical protein [Bdellovibrionales bacterium]MCB9083832.1 hypothetical protein [Pseudobdellovibrionaceae bacterium]
MSLFSRLWFFPLLFLLALAPIASQADLSARFRDLRGDTIEFAGDLKIKSLEGLNKAGYSVSERIWDRFSDLDIYSSDVGKLHFGVKLQRNVEDDNNGETFTVVDRIEVPLALPIFNANIGNLVTAEIPVSFSIGLSGGIKMTNIRQVRRGDALKLRDNDGDLKLVVENIRGEEWYKTAKDEFGMDEKYLVNPHLENPQLGSVSVDPLRHARYHRVLNRVAFPMRIPLKAEWINRIGLNEVMKYEGHGGVSFGPSVGWNFEPLDLRLSASVGAFLNGRFEISIMKVLNGEKKERVWLKVSRAKTKGINANIGGRSTTDIDGFVLMQKIGADADAVKAKMGSKIGGDKVAEFIADLYTVNFVPIRKSVTRQVSDIFEVGYEFDLSNPEAREAYEMAAIGLTHFADQIALETFNQGDKAPVRKIFGKKAKQKARIASSSFEATFLMKRSRNCRDDITNAIVEFPTGKQLEIRGQASCRMEETGALGSVFNGGFFNDAKVYSFHFEGAYVRNLDEPGRDSDQYGMYAVGYLEDKKTSGWELARYSGLVRRLIHNPEIIPSMPKIKVKFKKNPPYPVERDATPPDERGWPVEETINYGRTRLQLAVGFTREQLSKFVEVDEDKMMAIMQDVFDFYIHDDVKNLSPTDLKVGHYVNSFITLPISLINSNCKTCKAWAAMDEFYHNWLEAKDNRGKPEAIVQNFRKMFRRTQFGYEFALTIINSLEGEKLNYELNFQSGAFSKPIVAGGEFDIYGINALKDKFTKTRNFDIPRIYLDVDNSAHMGGVSAKAREDGAVDLDLSFGQRPQMVRIFVKEAKGWTWNRETVSEVLVRNVKEAETGSDTFPSGGRLSILLKPESGGFAGALARGLKPGGFYEVSAQVSTDGQRFGPLTTSGSFRIPE